MRLRVAALALLALLGGTAPTGPGGSHPVRAVTGNGAVPNPNIGILPASPDAAVMTPDSTNPFSNLAVVETDARASGGRCAYFYRGVDDLSSASIGYLMSLLGHPACITVSVFNITAVNTAHNPASCDPDWTTDQCRLDIVDAITTFAETYLRPNDMLFLGNEQNDYFDINTSERTYHTTLMLAIQNALKPYGVVTGPVLNYSAAKEAGISALWDDRFKLLALNAYSMSSWAVGAPSEGITAVQNAITFGKTLTPRVGINETGWPTSAAAGGSDAEQLTWATSLRSLVLSAKPWWVNVFIGMDGELTSCTDSTCECWAAAEGLGGSPGSDTSESWLCSMGLYDDGNGGTVAVKNSGAAWNALFGL